MRIHTLRLTSAAFAVALMPAAAHAQGCKADATPTGLKKLPVAEATPTPGKQSKFHPKQESHPALTWELTFEVSVEGCPAAEGRPNKFQKSAYGTINYDFHKKYAAGAALKESQDKSTANWDENAKGVIVTTKLVGKDEGGAFEPSDVKVSKVVCGCR